MKKQQIILIRHGQTQGNKEHRYVGSTDEPLLEESKNCICNITGDFLHENLRLFVSPMLRALQTAKALFPGREAMVVDELRECEFGDFEYKDYQELQTDERYQAFIDSGGTLAFPNGEAKEDFIHRTMIGFEKILQMVKGVDTIVIVAHGGTIMAILDRLSMPHRDYFDWQVAPLTGYQGQLQETENGWKVTQVTAWKMEDR
ncbi:MAG: histidine phosphatase family protein [Wujia sp.]